MADIVRCETENIRHLTGKKWHYSTVSQQLYSADLGLYHTYGIKVEGYMQTYILSDVSLRREAAEQMVSLFNRYQLSPLHLQDAVEDMLS